MGRSVLVALTAGLLGTGCIRGPERAGPSGGEEEDKPVLVFEDHFDRSEVGPDWLDTGGDYRIVDGRLRAKGARNRPLWLRRKLPEDGRVEFTARSLDPVVDIKAELWGDGRSRAETLSYTATSYVVILGGWNNTRSIIARMNEHGNDRVSRTAPLPVPGRDYRFSITRKKNRLKWSLDGAPFLEMGDPEPLRGAGHEYFAFNGWMSEVTFDDLAVFRL